MQPALKCRGRESMQPVCGLDYTPPKYLERLRERGLRAKRVLALKRLSLA